MVGLVSMNLGEQFEAYRVMKRMSKKELSEISGVSVDIIKKIENNDTATSDNLVMLASALGLSLTLSFIPNPIVPSRKLTTPSPAVRKEEYIEISTH